MSGKEPQFPRPNRNPAGLSFSNSDLMSEEISENSRFEDMFGWLQSQYYSSQDVADTMKFHGMILPEALRKFGGLWDVEEGEELRVKFRDFSQQENFPGVLEARYVESGLEPDYVTEREFNQAYQNGAIVVTGMPEELNQTMWENIAFRIESRPDKKIYDNPVEKLASLYGEDDPRTQTVDYLLNSGVEDRLT